MPAAIKADKFLEDSGRYAGQGTWGHDASQPSRGAGENTRRQSHDVETDASADSLADTLGELKSEKVGETLTDTKIASHA